jgi:hypothetical protein
MTIDRQKGNIVFECNGCHEVLETDTANWDTAMNLLHREHWRARKKGDEWHHYCDKCIGA